MQECYQPDSALVPTGVYMHCQAVINVVGESLLLWNCTTVVLREDHLPS